MVNSVKGYEWKKLLELYDIELSDRTLIDIILFHSPKLHWKLWNLFDFGRKSGSMTCNIYINFQIP